MKNILTVDVEDWYCDLSPDTWDKYEDRVEGATKKILKLLKETNNKATFFVLGYVAEKNPELIKTIQKEGHEIGSHGYWHRRITDQTSKIFEEDLLKSLRVLKKITKREIFGYRAPQFTILKETSYVIDILKKHGLKYDSSIFPAKTPLYGVSSAPLDKYFISSEDISKENLDKSFVEFPISIYEIPLIKKRLPLIGGIYFRFFPYFLTKHAIKKINKKKKPVVFFTHPWEFDPHKPKIPDLNWNHYYGIKHSEKKLRKLLKDHKFISIKEWMDGNENTRRRS
jgi:peptidoglycan-N-acetylglucosamine deacetylase